MAVNKSVAEAAPMEKCPENFSTRATLNGVAPVEIDPGIFSTPLVQTKKNKIAKIEFNGARQKYRHGEGPA